MSSIETIFARSTAPGKAGIAVLRLSGPRAGVVLSVLTGRALPSPRMASLATFRDPGNGQAIDQGLALWFPGPASFTGEDVVEIHCHGSRAVVAEFYRVLSEVAGCRAAEAGEFTRRAFDNGRMDLTQVEGLADLLEAETAAQQRQALRQMGGELGRLYDSWRDRLVRSLAHVEAEIDFPEEDLPGDMLEPVRKDVASLQADIHGHLADSRRGERLRDGFRIAIIGAPNVGKSSLLNALSRRDAAIVSDIAGTTRDVIEVHLDIEGYPVLLADTAGIRETLDPVEREGVVRSEQRMADADLVIEVLDARDPVSPVPGDDRHIRVLNKIDLAPDATVPAGSLALSVREGHGIGKLLAAITDRLNLSEDEGAQSDLPLTRARHRQALERAMVSLDRFHNAALPELAAEDLRLAMRDIGRITGSVDVEDLLDVIFRDFCIGK